MFCSVNALLLGLKLKHSCQPRQPFNLPNRPVLELILGCKLWTQLLSTRSDVTGSMMQERCYDATMISFCCVKGDVWSASSTALRQKNRTNSKQNENRKQTMHILTVRVIATSPHVPVVSATSIHIPVVSVAQCSCRSR